MSPERWRRIQDVFDAAVGLGGAERDAFLSGACAGDAELRAQVDELLAHDAVVEADGFLEAPTPRTRPRQPSAVVERYRMLREHARGGLGEVLVAEDVELHREVAVKRMQAHCEADPDSRRRFLLEAEITGRLEHPGVVPVYGLTQNDDGRSGYAMRLIRGETLDQAIGRFHAQEGPGRDPGERSLALRELLGRFVAVCQTVAYAHSRGVLHRDLKPGNIMLGKYGETLVVDWGLAKLIDCGEAAGSAEEETMLLDAGSSDSGTRTGAAMGTPDFMSPEQAKGEKKLGPASDIYSLGVILYKLLTGKTPLAGGDIEAKLLRLKQGEFARPRQLHMACPAALEAVCLKAMALWQEDRYGTALDLAGDVERWLADEPVQAWVEPWTVRARRWGRKHRALVVSAAAVLLVMAIVSVVGAVVFGRLNRQLETEAATATAVKDYLLHDLLELADASKQKEQEATGIKMDSDLKVRDLVLRAVQRIEGRFPDQPLVEAEIRSTLGSTLIAIGHADLARLQFLRARDLYTARLGPDHPATLGSMHSLAVSFYDLGRYADALKLGEETLARTKARFGPDHPDTLLRIPIVAAGYLRLARHAEALELLREALPRMKAKLGPHHPVTLDSMHNLSLSHDAHGRYDEANKLREETLALARAGLGPDHPITLLRMHSVATSYANLGRYDEAIKLYHETLALMKGKLGPDHPNTLRSINNLAACYAARGRHAEALELHEEVLRLMTAKLGPDHPNTVGSMYNIACVHALMIPKSDNSAKQADHAMTLLTQAVAAGWDDLVHMKKDPDLNVLRDREDFKKLLAELERKAPEPKK
jgi:tetratricopeptide (TPR) repeat protein